MKINSDALRSELANYAHEAWSGWMKYLFKQGSWNENGQFIIKADSCARWTRQMETSMALLPEGEENSDYEEADKIIKIIERILLDDTEDGERVMDGGASTDRLFLEKLADELESPEITADVGSPEIVRKLRSIAIGCDRLALEKLRLVKREEQVDRELCRVAEAWMNGEQEVDTSGALVAAIWLLCRRTQSQGTKSALASGLGVIGASLLGGFGKTDKP